MPKINIKEIKTLARERVRKDYGDIEELANSISRYGQIQPIVLDEQNVLIAGGRRLAAHIHLGIEEIEFIFRNDVSESLRKELELEENLRRKDLTWVEEVRAVKALYDLKIQSLGARHEGTRDNSRFNDDDQGYSMAVASRELGRSKANIVTDINLARAVEEFPDLEKEGSKASAWKRYKLEKEKQIRAEQARRTRVDDQEPAERSKDPFLLPGEEGYDDVEEDTDSPTPAPTPVDRAPTSSLPRKISWKGHGLLYLADSAELCKVMSPRSIDCIVTDPPFALGMFKEGSKTSGGRLAEAAGHMYDDDPVKTMDMLDRVFMYASKLLKPNGHVYCFLHMTKYEEMYLIMRHHFGVCEETPLIWAKNTPGIGDPNKTWVYSYEPILWVNKGRHLVKPQAFNVLRYDTIPPGQKIHPTEKPAALLRHIIGASCLPGEVILDPFAGSGSTLVAAAQLGCKFIGIEKEEKFHRAAVERVSEVLATQVTPAENKDQNAHEAVAEVVHGTDEPEQEGTSS